MTKTSPGPSHTGASGADPGYDADALRAKYREERDKRLRSDGVDQYVQVSGEFARFVDDPYVEPGYTREPLTDEVDVVVIGGGFGGIMAGARLRQAGVEDIRLIEKGGDFGGTWYWNRYPGVACDIESYVYMPMLEDMDYIPKDRYARGSEIHAHAKAIAEKYDLYRDVCFQTLVTELRWDEDSSRWTISTDRGDAIRARFVCLANGFLQRPKLPGIPGVETFKGRSFHTCRWDFEYTGGDAEGNLSGLRDKRVGIIGTGASAIQAIPHLGASAEHLYVFQRTPSPIDVRGNRPTHPDFGSGLEPGWHEHRMDNFQFYTAAGSREEDLVKDGWTDLVHKKISILRANKKLDRSERMSISECMEAADFVKMEELRARVDAVIEDPATAEALKPYYRPFCKRPCFHDEYLPTFNLPNVTLVDTHGLGVERVTETGVVVDGEAYELDCLIYATGFEVWTEYARRSGYETYGRDGLSLSEKWKDGITTMHGMHIRGFPNCIMMSIAQSGVTMSFTYILNEQTKILAHVISRALAADRKTFEVSQEAETEWVDSVLAHSSDRSAFFEDCTPGYINNEGRDREKFRQNGFFFGEPTEFKKILEEWQAAGDMKGLELEES
jgi:cyclohexanone monooxygenase